MAKPANPQLITDHPLVNNLALAFMFAEGSGTTTADLSLSGGNDGTLQGFASWGTVSDEVAIQSNSGGHILFTPIALAPGWTVVMVYNNPVAGVVYEPLFGSSVSDQNCHYHRTGGGHRIQYNDGTTTQVSWDNQAGVEGERVWSVGFDGSTHRESRDGETREVGAAGKTFDFSNVNAVMNGRGTPQNNYVKMFLLFNTFLSSEWLTSFGADPYQMFSDVPQIPGPEFDPISGEVGAWIPTISGDNDAGDLV